MNDTRTFLEYKAYRLRMHSLTSTTAAGSGHPTSCLSAADLVAALFFNVMQFNPEHPHDPHNDQFVLSKGHAAPLLYAAWRERGFLTDQELLTLRSFDSNLEGHPTPRFPCVDVATGSLGIGLSIGVGKALWAQRNSIPSNTYVLMGDSELTEGSIWEAAHLASFYKLDHLIAIIDVNRLGQSTPTIEGHNLEQHAARWRGFGWQALIIDGHDISRILEAFEQARVTPNQPTVILAKTIKGYGVASIENKEGYHGKAFTAAELPEKLNELKQRFARVAAMHYDEPPHHTCTTQAAPQLPSYAPPVSGYKQGDLIATRKAYGQALAAYGALVKNIVSLDAEVKNSTYADIFEAAFPDRFVQCFIAEQCMIGMATGFASRGSIPFASTFGAFLTRAYDQLRMAAIGQSPLRIVGSHAGVSIGEDGPSQMALEDIAMMRTLPASIVLYPCDGMSTYKLVGRMIEYNKGISYLRTTRGATPVIYAEHEEFVIGGCKVLRQSDHDVVCVIAAGITVFEALKAYELLAQQSIAIAVIDSYSIKPLDSTTIKSIAQKSAGRIITVEDHYTQGGLGEAVCHALSGGRYNIETLAVTKLARSGKPAELLAYEEIDAQAIMNRIHMMMHST